MRLTSVYTGGLLVGAYLMHRMYRDHKWLPAACQDLGDLNALVEELQDFHVGSRYKGKKHDILEFKKLQVVSNIYSSIVEDSNLEARCSEIVQLPRFFAPNQVEERDMFFVVLPTYYIRRIRAGPDQITRSIDGKPLGLTPEEEAAFHYRKYTKDLCRSYLLRRGPAGWQLYLEFLLADAAFHLALIAFGPVGARWVRKRVRTRFANRNKGKSSET